jgi:RNA polymerase sigma factor (sigma-70 family)
MNDYNVKIKVRNNRLLQAIYDSGGEPGFKWCHANGLRYNSVNLLLNMTESPINKRTGDYTETAMQLCMVLKKIPSDLWNEDQLTALDTNTAEFDMSKEQITSLMNNEEQSYLQDFDSFELKTIMENAINLLPEREQLILRLHYFDGLTLDEISSKIDISKERIRQIEMKALRRLRHPTRSEDMRHFLTTADSHMEKKDWEAKQEATIKVVQNSKQWWEMRGTIHANH